MKDIYGVEIVATDKASATINNVSKAMGKMSKSATKSRRAMTAIAYGIDDLQYGFRGVQNNIQQLAVTMGASGPLVLGITAASVALGYLIEKTDLFNFSSKNMSKGIDDAIKKLKEFREEIEGPPPLADQVDKIVNPELKKAEAELARLTEKHTRTRFDPGLGGYYTETYVLGTNEQIKAIKEKIAELKKEAAATREVAQAEQDRQDTLNRLKDQADIPSFSSNLGLDFGADPGLKDVFNIQGEDFQVIEDGIEVIDEFGASLEDLEEILRSTGSAYAGLSVEQSQALMELGDGLMTAAEQTELYANAIVGAFDSAAAGGGNFFAKFVKSILGSIGSILVSEGIAAIVLGINRNAIAPGSGTASIVTGKKTLATGLALKAGQLLTGTGGSASGAASPTGRSLSYANPNATATQTQGFGGDGRFIGELKLRGQDLFVALQAANRTRNTF